MSPTLPFIGPLFDLIDAVLREQPAYRQFRSGALTRAEFASFLDQWAPMMTAHGVPVNDVHFAKRFPVSSDQLVRQSLDELARAGLIACSDYPQDLIDGLAHTIHTEFDHGGLGTYIYPEEGRLLLAIAHAVRPRNAIFLGSYYGYWAAWALHAIIAAGGRAVLVDPDPHTCRVAQRSLHRLYPSDRVQVVVATGEDYLATCDEFFDFVVLDAELPRTHPDAGRRGKGIYYHLLNAVLPRLLKPAMLICHNILFRDHSGAAFFDTVIARNKQELSRFNALVSAEFADFVELPTTEGMGIGVRQ